MVSLVRSSAVGPKPPEVITISDRESAISITFFSLLLLSDALIEYGNFKKFYYRHKRESIRRGQNLAAQLQQPDCHFFYFAVQPVALAAKHVLVLKDGAFAGEIADTAGLAVDALSAEYHRILEIAE